MIEVKTIWNEQLLRKFNAAQIRSKLWMPALVATVLLAAGVVCLFVDKLGAACGVPIICIAALVPLAYMAVTHVLLTKTLRSSAAVQNGTTQIVRFSDSIFVNESGTYTAAQDTRIAYDEVTKAVESESAFCLYAGARVYLLDTKGFGMGSRRELHDLLREKLGDKRFRYPKRLYAS